MPDDEATVWVVIDPDNEDTPLGGVWSSMRLAKEHQPEGYVIIRLRLDEDLTKEAASG